MIVMLWRGGLRVHGHSRSASTTLTRSAGLCSCATARAADGARSAWTRGGWEHLWPWLTQPAPLETPVGPVFCIIYGPTLGRPWSAAAVRSELRRHAAEAGVRRRFAPHQLRHAHVVELARESVSLNVIQRQLEHANLRHHEHLPAGNRHRGDHLHRARPPSADDVGDSGPPARSHRTPSRERRGVCSRVRRPRHFCFSPSSARQTAALVAIPRRLVLVLTSRPERSSADARKSREAAVSALRQFEEGMSCIRDRMVTRRLSYRHG